MSATDLLPAMDYAQLRCLLHICVDQKTDWVRWQPLPDFETGRRFEIQNLRPRDLIEHALPVIEALDKYREEAREAKRHGEELKERLRRKLERLAYLEEIAIRHGWNEDEELES